MNILLGCGFLGLDGTSTLLVLSKKSLCKYMKQYQSLTTVSQVRRGEKKPLRFRRLKLKLMIMVKLEKMFWEASSSIFILITSARMPSIKASIKCLIVLL